MSRCYARFVLTRIKRSFSGFSSETTLTEVDRLMMAVMMWLAAIMAYGASLGMTQDSGSGILLGMSEDAVDDMYDGCKKEMARKAEGYLPNEKNQDQNFKRAWCEAELYVKGKFQKTLHRNKKIPNSIGKEQITAIYVYTLDHPPIYLDFNAAVRSQRSEYKTTFKYHALHFFLTDAIQKLRSRQEEPGKCWTTFSRKKTLFRLRSRNTLIRFGGFMSTSMGGYPKPETYGDKTCFNVTTCFGADISLYSKFGDFEKEVLIPPYEIFKVTKVEKRTAKKTLPCEVVYTLKSTGTPLSNLNCSLVF
ncbi:ecto-ADP-ribosyltransferase 5-like [Nerophis ophidion]|uniref:ecto-ADP-ribosyltransferase 5-like n=1 Tax=Nerophis ophidion TaxID=159077 RepID=UPI002ADFE88F|nr:ecto-ADP-ribosyltransferase 5-like [Nerophis ophidion]